MKQAWKRWLASALAAVMLLSLLPLTEGGTAFAVGTYGRITGRSVAFRKGPSTDYEIWFRLGNGVIATVLDQVPVKNGKIWYKIILEKPGSNSGNTYVGYVHSDYFALLTEEEAAAWEANPVNQPPATGNVKANGAVGTITNGGVNLRAQPSMKGSVLFVLERGTAVDVLTIPAANDPDPWYQVEYAGYTGYVKGEFLRLTNPGTQTNPPVTGNTDTPPVTAVTATPVPVNPTGDRYVRLLLSAAPLYDIPNGVQRTTWTGTGSTLPLAGSARMVAGASWYPVTYQGAVYYVRGDYVQETTTPGQVTPATASPVPGTVVTAQPYSPAMGYVRTIKGDVNLRLKPAGEVVQIVARNQVFPYLSAPVNEAGYDWYYVQSGNVRGYLRGDCVVQCTADGTALTVQTVVTPTPAPDVTAVPAAAFGYVRTTVGNVNLRDRPAGETIEQIKKNVVLRLNGSTMKSGNYTWYPVVSTTGRSGYLRGDCVQLTNADGTTTPATPTPVPAAVTPTPAPVVPDAANIVYGYVQTTKASVNVRKKPAGDSFTTVKKGTVLPLFATPVSASGYTWYPVTVNGTNGYLRGDCVSQLNAEQVAAYLAGQGIPTAAPTPTPTPAPVTVNFVQTTVDYVNIRKSASKDSQSVGKVRTGTVMAYSGTSTVGGSRWYNVTYKGDSLWVLGSCVKVMTADEYNAYAAAHPNANVEPAAAGGGYVRTIKGGVNVRKTAAGSNVIGQVPRNMVFAYTSVTNASKYEWYKVTTNYGVGWIRGDCVTECQANGSDLEPVVITPAPTANPGGSGVIIDNSQIEASYKILKLGSSGSAVTKLVQALTNQGYYNGPSTSSYTTDVEAAVRAFQTAKSLNVDGIAGSATQHALFGTVPVGTVDGSDMRMVIYPAEKIDCSRAASRSSGRAAPT